jgi:glutamate-ammonia-ligase adenylyltransferase
MPLILKRAGLSEQPDLALKRIIDLIQTIERRTAYIALLLENPEALTHMVYLANASPWIISYLARHPVLIDELLDPRTLYTPPEKENLIKTLRKHMEQTDPHDQEQQIEKLAIFKQSNILRVATSDVSGAFPLMKVSDFLSYIAEAILDQVLELSWKHLAAKHGIPASLPDNRISDKGFAVIAYGKLGGLELGYGSDLDLIFLYEESAVQTGGGIKPVDASQFYARLGQRIIHILTAHTRAGKLYDIDMRLRPSGSSGPLASSMAAFKNYQAQEAWTWEHQALVRARSICGDAQVAKRFEKMRREILSTPREPDRLKDDIRSMRERLRKEHETLRPGGFDIKQGRGGIVDIEFLVQYLVLLHAHQHRELAEWSDNVRQIEALEKNGILKNQTALFLKEAYLAFRKEVHRLNLQEKPATVPEEKFHTLRTEVKKVWNHYLE